MKKLGFLGKQVAAYSLLITAVMLILTFFANSYIMRIARENAVISQEQLTVSTVRQVDNYLEQLMLVATQVAHDSEIIKSMEVLAQPGNQEDANYFLENPEALVHVLNLLFNHNGGPDPFYRIDVFNLDGDYISTNPAPDILQAGQAFTEDQSYRDFLTRVFINEDRDYVLLGPLVFFLPDDLKGQNYIYMEVPIKSYDGTEIYGYVNVYQSLDALYTQLQTSEQSATQIYLCYNINHGELGRAFYPPDQLLPDLIPTNYHETIVQSRYDIFIVLLQDQAAFLAPYQQIQFYLYGICLALLVLLLICVYLLVRNTSKPILALNQKVREATLSTPFEPPATMKALDEVKELTYSVEQMTQRLKASAELEKQAYLRALQAQMKPHFLYNCLSTISGMGVEAHSRDIPKFCSSLASILRYESIYDDKATTLDDELKNVSNYLELMKLRYENDFTYTVDADPSLRSQPMPHLVLQPLVENCFDHGFHTALPPWHVSLEVCREETDWVIRVSDNGSGFSKESLRVLQERLQTLLDAPQINYSQLQIGGLGLANTILRLYLQTDGKLTYSITPNAPTGTIVTLKGALHV